MKHVFFIIILLISLVVINNLLRSILSLSQKQDLISHAQKQLDKEKKENTELKKQLTQVTRQQFVEEQARNKLFMVKEGEHLVILPQDMMQASEAAVQKKEKKKTPVEEWIALFFKQGE